MTAVRNRIEALAAGPFFVVRVNVVNAVGGLHEAILLDYLLRWGELAPDGWAYRTEDEITADTTLNRYQQRKAREALVELGLMHEERRGLPSRNYYRVDYDRLHDLLGETGPTRKTTDDSQERPPSPLLGDDSGLAYIGDTGEEQTKQQSTPLPPEGGGKKKPRKAFTYTPEFEAWWKLYPSGRGIKIDAFEEWQLLSDADRADAMDALPSWVACQKWQAEPHYIPHAERWLKKRRWEGTPPPAEQPRQIYQQPSRPVYANTEQY